MFFFSRARARKFRTAAMHDGKKNTNFPKKIVRFRDLFLDGVDVDDACIMEQTLDNYKFLIEDNLSKITQNSNFHYFS